jgi:ATP synthase protein I
MTDEARRSRVAPPPDRDVIEAVGRKAERKLRARRAGRRGVWFGLGMFGLVGWAVALPTVAGVALGLWLDTRFPSRVSWTLTLLSVGALLGSVNAWYWVKRESRDE